MKNHLSESNNPYLVQHATNPVHWMTWCNEAFEKAAKEDKPVFLSIGYSTCHWCHVMAYESFEDSEVADYLNEHFVSVKVDREEHPEIDHLYMTVCQMATGQGGWPLTIVMTPEKRPFFAGTYFPKISTPHRIGMLELLPKIIDAWQDRREEILTAANQTFMGLVQEVIIPPGGQLDSSCIDSAMTQFKEQYDSTYGGFGGAPKFPTPHHLLFLLTQYRLTKDDTVLSMVTYTLTKMRLGGLYDHVGYGFHRYSTDDKWHLPHFEKMLYDQALLIWSYAEAYSVTQEPLFKETVKEVITYIHREMQSPKGGVYAAEDADTEGEEGKFYVWTYDELLKYLGKDTVSQLDVSVDGNFLDEATRQFTNANIIYARSESELSVIEKSRDKLMKVRKERVLPGKDTKVLTDWNALLVIALAKAGMLCEEPDWVRQAEQLFTQLWTEEKIDHCNGKRGLLSDYAALGLAAITLFESTCKQEYLTYSKILMKQLSSLFLDASKGGYFMAEDHPHLIVRQKEYYDGALPSGNSMVYLLLIRLSQLTGDDSYQTQLESLINCFSSKIQAFPMGYTFWLYAESIHKLNPVNACLK